MKEYDVVNVIRLTNSERQYDGSEGVKRSPQIGDVGTIVHTYEKDGQDVRYIVECVDSEGYTIWLADFLPEEIQSNN